MEEQLDFLKKLEEEKKESEVKTEEPKPFEAPGCPLCELYGPMGCPKHRKENGTRE
jgi:hypothetical protein